MCESLKLSETLPGDIIWASIYNEKLGVTEVITAVVLPEEKPTVLSILVKNFVGAFRFRGTRHGQLSLPNHLVLSGRMLVCRMRRDENSTEESWKVLELALKHDPDLAEDLRFAGYFNLAR